MNADECPPRDLCVTKCYDQKVNHSIFAWRRHVIIIVPHDDDK